MFLAAVAEFAYYLMIFGMILAFLNPIWFANYVDKLAALAYFIGMLVGGVLSGLLILSWKALRGIPKALAVSTIMVALALVYLLTFPVPRVGKRIEDLQQRLLRIVDSGRFEDTVDQVRSSFIQIVTEHDDPTPEFDLEEEYRDKLVEVRDESSKRLNRGESVLTLGFSALLLVSTFLDLQLFSIQMYGYSFTIFLELYVLMVTVSILYRTAILDLLSYTGEEEFSSLKEMDTALTYQRAVSLAKIAQSMMVLLVAVTALTPSKFRTALPAIKKRYRENLTFIQTMKFVWRELQTGDQ